MTAQTTTAQTDLMDEFRANRYAQIQSISERAAALEEDVKAGKLRKISGGRFQVTEGWDRGEILSDQGMPEHNLTVNEAGNVEFYASGKRPWHELGTYLEDGLYSAKAALTAAGCGFDVVKRRAWFAESDELFPGEDNPLHIGDDDMFMVVRTDTMKALGMVGKIWTHIPNENAFGWMEEMGQPFETAGSFRGGRRVFATMALPEDMTVDAGGVNEQIKMYLAAINHLDGNGGLKLYATPYRIECGNTERLAVDGAVTSWTVKHTINYDRRLAEATKALKLTHKYAEAWTRDANKLVNTKITDAEIAKVISDVWAVDEDEDGARKVKKAEARVMDIMNRWAVERERAGQNAYAFERALTGHLDHGAEFRPRGELKGKSPLAVLGAAILEDTQAEAKNKVHKRMMALVRK